MAHPIDVTESNFVDEVTNSELPVLVDFWAAWCGPCRAVGPVVEEIADDYSGRLKVAKVDIDAEPGLASRFRIQSIPAIVLFKDGEVISTAVGARRKPLLIDALQLDAHVQPTAA